MTFRDVSDWLNYYLYNETELFIWCVIAALIILAAGAAIYSIKFRRFLAVSLILSVAIIWLANKYYFTSA